MKPSIQKRLDDLEDQRRPVAPVLMVDMAFGESRDLVVKGWRKEHPEAPEPDEIIAREAFGAYPRRKYCTKYSLEKALPQIKHFLAMRNSRTDKWRKLARSFSINWDRLEAVKPASEPMG